jgi:PKD repeat protein
VFLGSWLCWVLGCGGAYFTCVWGFEVLSVANRRVKLAFVCAFVTLGIAALSAGPASAVVVRLAGGDIAGVAPRADVSPGQIPGGLAEGAVPLSGVNGRLDFHSGQVLHSSAPYVIFWDPSSLISTASRNLLSRYLSDSARDDGLATNVWSVNRQFTDSTGFADYAQTFSGAQVIVDPQAFPSRNTSVCNRINVTFYPNCLTDGQLQTELTRLIAADSLPTGTGADAPVYLLVTPPNTNECAQAGTCADNQFCAYHSSYVTGGRTVLYAEIPLFYNGASPAQNPKNCQFDGNSVVQAPNGNALVDVATKYLSHELSETLTDPVNGGGWWDNSSGNEDGDNCNFFGATVDPQNSSNPNAFGPVLGGSAAAGTLFDQIINGDRYYTQTEWSNGELNCEAKPATQTLTPAFTTPSGVLGVGNSLSFDGSGSTIGSGDAYSSVTWDFGDGSAASFSRATAPGAVNHTYSAAGTYTVRLTAVDGSGNLATVSHQVVVGTPPVAAFTAPVSANPGSSVSFDASGSSQTDGATIVSYDWDFGDGTTGTGISTTHSYSVRGTYTVTLTVTDSDGFTGSVSHQILIHTAPTAAFGFAPAPPSAGQTVTFTSQTTPGDGTITSYQWDFGDGSANGTGSSPTHVYGAGGSYSVTLTVTDSNNLSSSITQMVDVKSLPVAAFTAPASAKPGSSVSFDASGSSQTDGATIVSYDWDFGDGTTATTTVPAETHSFTAGGTDTVTLTVTDSDGFTGSVSHQILIHTAPTSAFTPSSGGIAGKAVSFSSQTTPGDGTLASYAWDFGDGTSGSGANPSHTYPRGASFTVTLTVTDSNNLTSSISHQIVIGGQPTAMLRVLTGHPFAGAATAFDGSESSDPGGTISRYGWSFGDGGAGSGASLSHTYKNTGSYLVQLTVTDIDGASSTVSTTVRVIADTITNVTAGHERSVKITLSGPGTLTIGKHKITVKRAGVVTVKLTLTKAQAHNLAAHHKLKLKLKVTFLPAGAGGPVIKTVHITLHS